MKSSLYKLLGELVHLEKGHFNYFCTFGLSIVFRNLIILRYKRDLNGLILDAHAVLLRATISFRYLFAGFTLR